MGLEAENTQLSRLGHARRVPSSRRRLDVVDGAGDGRQHEVTQQPDQKNEILRTLDSDFDREKLEERLAKLSGGVCSSRSAQPTDGDEGRSTASRVHPAGDPGGAPPRGMHARRWRRRLAAGPNAVSRQLVRRREAGRRRAHRAGSASGSEQAPLRQIADDAGAPVVVNDVQGQERPGLNQPPESRRSRRGGVHRPGQVTRSHCRRARSLKHILRPRRSSPKSRQGSRPWRVAVACRHERDDVAGGAGFDLTTVCFAKGPAPRRALRLRWWGRGLWSAPTTSDDRSRRTGRPTDWALPFDVLDRAAARADILGDGADKLASRFCSRMCADQPATRAQVNIEVKRCGGYAARSRITADQNSTFVASTRSGFRSWSSARAAFSRASATSKRGDPSSLRSGAVLAPGGLPHGRCGARSPSGARRGQARRDPLSGVAGLFHFVEHLQHPRGGAPCSGPDSAPTAAERAAAQSAPVEATTRAVKVDAFTPCSAAEIQ